MAGGTVNISRSLWDDEAFAADPFSEREAWIWMIAEASWKPRTRRVGDYIVDLDRGQLAGSIRFFAKAWKWTPAKVQRFLDRVQRMNLIRRKTDTGVTVITVCKYDEYQNKTKAADTRPIQDRYTSDTNENKGEIKGKEEEGQNAPQGWLTGFDEFWQVWPHKVAKEAARKAWKKLKPEERDRATEAAANWFSAWRQRHPDASGIHPASYLNAKRWTDEEQTPQAPRDGPQPFYAHFLHQQRGTG